MPTGYTANIKDGITFEEFVWTCSRAMGALVMMRDESSDTPIPEKFEPSDYHLNARHEAEKNLLALLNMNDEELETAALEEYYKEVKYQGDVIVDCVDLRQKYTSMLLQVENWTPPTDDHTNFKKFMIEQLTRSIDFDCNDSFYQKMKINRLSGKKWLIKESARYKKDIAYYAAEYTDEIRRTEVRNKWIQDLRSSLSN